MISSYNRPRALHLPQSDHPDAKSRIQRPTLCGDWANPDDVTLTLSDVTCHACLERDRADNAAIARELGELPPAGTYSERLNAVEHRMLELARELAAVRQLVEQLKLGTAELLEHLDRGVSWRARS